MANRNACVIDTNCLVLHIVDSYANDSVIALPPTQGDAIFQILLQDWEAYKHVSRKDFGALFSLYRFYNTTSYIISEAQHIITKKIKNQGVNPQEIFRYGANLFKTPQQIQDTFVGFVEVVDVPESKIQWDIQIAFDEFGIEDMSLLVLSQSLKLPFLTLDSRFKAFIRYNLPEIKLVETEQLLN